MASFLESARDKMDFLRFFPNAPLDCVERRSVTFSPAIHDSSVPTGTRLGAFASDGTFLSEFRIQRGAKYSVEEQAPSAVEERFAGTAIYGGVMFPHYGHFLLESLSRAWFALQHPQLPIFWHASNGLDTMSKWRWEVFGLLGVSAARIKFIMRPTLVDHVLLPDAGCVLDRWIDPLHARAIGVVPFADRPLSGKRVWLSRSRLPEKLARIDGESEMEGCLAAAGWTVIYPEDLTVQEQLSAMADAEEIAGFEGSAFYTLLLAGNVRARITMYRRSKGPPPASFSLMAFAKHLRFDLGDLALAEDGSADRAPRRRLMTLADPAAAARTIVTRGSGDGAPRRHLVTLAGPAAKASTFAEPQNANSTSMATGAGQSTISTAQRLSLWATGMRRLILRAAAQPIARATPIAENSSDGAKSISHHSASALLTGVERKAEGGVQERKLAFIHIPKTAGTALTRALSVGWPRVRVVRNRVQFAAITNDEIDNLDLIAGHFRAHHFDERKLVNFDAFTVLRDPFERMFSSYRFARASALERGVQGGKAMRLAVELPFAEWVVSEIGHAQRHAQLLFLGLNSADNPVRTPVEKLLNQAKKRIDTMHVVTTDYIDDFMVYLFQQYNKITPPQISRENITPRFDPGLTVAQMQELQELLRPDYALVEYGREVMLRRMDKSTHVADIRNGFT